MTVESKLITADELLKMGDIGRCELIQGELIMMSPAGMWHGAVAARFAMLLAKFVDANELGIVFGAETGFRFGSDPDTVRAPDASFVQKGRLPKKMTRGYFQGVPDLAVEVVSPDDSKRGVIDKANMWLANGTQVVWIADPPQASVSIHRVGVPIQVMKVGDVLCDEPLLPGFSLDVTLLYKLL